MPSLQNEPLQMAFESLPPAALQMFKGFSSSKLHGFFSSEISMENEIHGQNGQNIQNTSKYQLYKASAWFI